MSDRSYEVLTPVLINGKVRQKGDVVSHLEIMSREPHRLGSLLRVGHIRELAPPAPPEEEAATPPTKKAPAKRKAPAKKEKADG